MEKPYVVLSPDGKFVHRKYDGKLAIDTPVKVRFTEYDIQIGCTIISVEAAEKIMSLFHREIKPPVNPLREIIIQDGWEPRTNNNFPTSSC